LTEAAIMPLEDWRSSIDEIALVLLACRAWFEAQELPFTTADLLKMAELVVIQRHQLDVGSLMLRKALDSMGAKLIQDVDITP
jgi:hypothetical protein